MPYTNPNWSTSWSQLSYAMNHLDQTQWNKLAEYLENGNYSRVEVESILKEVPEMSTMWNKNGELIGVTYKGAGATNTAINTASAGINSNIATSTSGSKALVKQAVQIKNRVGTTSKTVTNELTRWRGGTPTTSTGLTMLSSVLSGVMAVSVGGSLGKTIDRTLYNAFPDFWDSHGMGALNPDTWNSITAGENGAGAALLNAFLDIDPNTGNPTMYVDEKAFAYTAMYMQSKGLFEPTDATVSDATLQELGIANYVNQPIHENGFIIKHKGNDRVEWITSTGKMASFTSGSQTFIIHGSTSPITVSQHIQYAGQSEHVITTTINTPSTVLGQTIYAGLTITYLPETDNITTGTQNNIMLGVAYIMTYGNHSYSIDGINDQPDAQLPQLNNGMSLDEVLNALKSQYPNLWDNRIEYDPTGENPTDYVPVTMPTGGTGNQPTNAGASQGNPTPDVSNNGSNVSDELMKLLFDMINRLQDEKDGAGMNDPDSANPTDDKNGLNPPDDTEPTGDGSTPAIVDPEGSASALWKIYNPTQAQVDSFGAWLWSSNFVDQIKKLFNDPMQAIIGLHKVYCTPTTGGSTTIKVGYLDSNVASNYVSNQYKDVDCGTINVKEYFGNVFDYPPYTKMSLYLPFIGFVDIDVNDVIRGKMSVVYHIDVLTGACLVDVKCTRDLNNVVMYTFSGNCAVQYPVSSGSYVGIVTGLLGIAGGVAGTIASGGALAPMLMGAGASIGNMHTSVKHSGNISANAGAMGIKKPYLLISRPQTKIPVDGVNIEGLPQNETVLLGSLTGKVIVKKCHYDGIPCTANELETIKSKLENGVYIN